MGIRYNIAIHMAKLKWILKNYMTPTTIVGEPVRYNKDFLATAHNSGFMDDPSFQKAYKAGLSTGSWINVEWRAHVMLWAANQCKDIVGDFIECGTNKGGFARTIVEALDLNKLQKNFYLLDTFNGFDESLLTPEEKKTLVGNGKYEECYEYVKTVFKNFTNVKIVRGSVPNTWDKVDSQQFSFASIDMNCVQPETEALNYIWPRLSKGGMIVLDDYAFVGFEDQYKAHNKWAADLGIQILSLPTGQGLLIKN
jgi:O-methyltransferase